MNSEEVEVAEEEAVVDHPADRHQEVADHRITSLIAPTEVLFTVADLTPFFMFTTFHQIITMHLDTTRHCICKPTTMGMAGTFTITWGTITQAPQMLLFQHLHLIMPSL